MRGTLDFSSQFFFLIVVICHAKDAKLTKDINGVIKGKAKMKRTNIALIP